MLVELHAHTKYSYGTKVPVEGLNTPEEIVRHAARLGIGAIAITDHDTMKGCAAAKRCASKYGIVFIPGEEITTISGHILAIGTDEPVQSGMSVEDTIDDIHDAGGIAIGDHPFDIKGDGIGELARHTDAIEVFNAINMDRISNRKSLKFANIHKKPKVAGSDAHWTEMLGHGLNEMNAANVDEIIKCIKKGKVVLKTKYMPANIIMKWSVERLKLSYPYTLNYINNNYRWPKRVISRNMLSLVKKSPGKVDYMFKGLTYVGLGSVIMYSAVKNILDM